MKLVFVEKCIVILAALSTCIQSYIDRSCPDNLTNTVAYVGKSASFTRVNDGQPVQWQFEPTSDTSYSLQTITNYDDVVVSEFSSAFTVSNSTLTIVNSTVAPLGSVAYSTAGMYILSYRNSNCSTAANLIVINNGPYCSYNASDPSNMTLSCSVDFAVATIQPNNPIFTWKNGITVVQQEEPQPSRINSSLSRSESQIQIDSNDATTYKCQLTFGEAQQTSIFFKTPTAPNFTASCSVSNPFAQGCSANLTNIVVYEGNRASFKRLSSSQRVQWQMFSSSDASNILQNITNYDGVVVSKFNSSYASNSTDLVILNSSAAVGYLPSGYATAGLYVLRNEDSSCVTAANLIVIRSGPYCSYNASDPASVTLSCTVDFAASSIQPNYPSFTWKNGISDVQLQQSTHSKIISSLSGLNRSESQIRIDSNDATIYECQLTFSPTSQAPFDYVTTTPPNFTASCFVSTSDVFINPSFGPKAGGTVMTIVTNLTRQNVSIPAVYIGVNLMADYYNSSGNTVVVETPMIESELLINQPIPIILGISPISSNVSTGKYFTYKPNPIIVDVSPRELSISGGTILSVSGYNFDSVAYPLVRAAVIITNDTAITYYKESHAPCRQPTENGTKMVCMSPPIYIRQDFLMYLYNQTTLATNFNSRRKRKSFLKYAQQSEARNVLKGVTLSEVRSKRSATIKSITTNKTYTLSNSSGEDQMIIYVGMIFDGFKRYQNNVLLDSSGNFELKNPPNISCASEIQYSDIVTIQGSGFTQCCTKDDYTIRIGSGFCNVTKNPTDNALTCNPPKNKPQQTDADKLYCGDNFVLLVELKIKTWKCSCLKYPDGGTTKLIIIIVTTVGSTLVLIVVIAVILAIIKRKQRSKSLTHRELRSTQRSTLYAPNTNMTGNPQRKNNTMEETTENADSTYYSNHIQTAYLESKPEAFGQSYGYLRPTEDVYRNADEITY